MIIKKEEMKISQTYQADSAAQAPKSALRGLMQGVGLTGLACTLVIGATGTATAGDARDKAAVRGLGDALAKAFVQNDAELRASLFAEDGTFVTTAADFLQGQVAMPKDFGPETQQAVNGTTKAAPPISGVIGKVQSFTGSSVDAVAQALLGSRGGFHPFHAPTGCRTAMLRRFQTLMLAMARIKDARDFSS